MTGPGPETLVAELTARAAASPTRVAVTDDLRSLTYGELDAAADAVAAAVTRRCGSDVEPVAVLAAPGVDSVAALYGVMRAGKVALPLDDASPRDALVEVLEHSGAVLTLVDSSGSELRASGFDTFAISNALEGEAVEPVTRRAVAERDPALLFYTSGSTGRPKGFAIEHGSQLRAARSWCEFYGLLAEDRLALLFHPSFGASRVCMLGALATGSELRVYDARRVGAEALANRLNEDRVAFAHCSPSLLRSMLSQLPAREHYGSMRTLATGAEGLHSRDVATFRRKVASTCRLAHTFATSESGPISALVVDADTDAGDGPLPVGAPLPGGSVRIDAPDDHGIGEVLVAGPGVAGGYWRDDAQTRVRFVGEPGSPTRYFRTGDRGRLRPDGVLEHHGRIDRVVKVRGYSVDLVEVEGALLAAAPIAEAAVVLHERARSRLVAYVVPEHGAVLAPGRLRALLADRLPRYKVPANFVVLRALPRTSRDKLDTAALPPVPSDRPELGTPYVAPADALERTVAAAWEEVLEINPVGTHDEYADLGGDSLGAVEIVMRLRVELGREVPLAVFIEATTVASMAELLSRGGERPLLTPVVELRAGSSRPPFFCVHGSRGNVLVFRELADRLSPEQSFYGVQLAGARAQEAATSVKGLATAYVDEVVRERPDGPLVLGGYSFGGAIAFEMAHQLEVAGRPVALVVIFDLEVPELAHLEWLRLQRYKRINRRVRAALTQAAWRTRWPRWRRGRELFIRYGGPEFMWIERLTQRAYFRYRPSTYGGRVLVVRTARCPVPDLGWGAFATGELVVESVGGDHDAMLLPPAVDALARHLDGVLERIDRELPGPRSR